MDDYVQCPNCGEIFEVHSTRILTKRELEVAVLMARGLTTKEAAAALFVSIKTIEAHRKAIFNKAGARNLAEFTRWAIRHGLVEA